MCLKCLSSCLHRHLQVAVGNGVPNLPMAMQIVGIKPTLKCDGCGACRTYTTLIQQGKGRTRLQQVMDWCGGPDWDGPLIFDEARPLCLVLSKSLLEFVVVRACGWELQLCSAALLPALQCHNTVQWFMPQLEAAGAKVTTLCRQAEPASWMRPV